MSVFPSLSRFLADVHDQSLLRKRRMVSRVQPTSSQNNPIFSHKHLQACQGDSPSCSHGTLSISDFQGPLKTSESTIETQSTTSSHSPLSPTSTDTPPTTTPMNTYASTNTGSSDSQTSAQTSVLSSSSSPDPSASTPETTTDTSNSTFTKTASTSISSSLTSETRSMPPKPASRDHTPVPQSSSTNTTQLTPYPRLPDNSATIPVPTQGAPGISPTSVASSSSSSSSEHPNHVGAIVGGVIGGLAFLLLATVAAILLLRRRGARRTAPSAEFMDIARGTTPGPGPVRVEGAATPYGDRLLPLARQGSRGDEDEGPPAFTLGAYADPVLEKVQAAAAQREQYQRRDSYATAHAEHEEESTMGEGTEEGYGDEKGGYTWAM